MAIRTLALIVAICCTATLDAQEGKKDPYKNVDNDVRLAAIRHAQIWTPVDVATMDIKAGPQGAGTFPPRSTWCGVITEEKLKGAEVQLHHR
jgi:hypothetical protein